MVVFDLDPGAPAGIVECCEVALVLQGLFEQLGLVSLAKTSGSKGMQVYVPLNTPVSYAQTKPFARRIAEAARAADAEARHLADDQAAAAGEGARRLEPERRTQDHRDRLLRPRTRAPDGLDAGHLGGGRRLPRAAATRPC